MQYFFFHVPNTTRISNLLPRHDQQQPHVQCHSMHDPFFFSLILYPVSTNYFVSNFPHRPLTSHFPRHPKYFFFYLKDFFIYLTHYSTNISISSFNLFVIVFPILTLTFTLQSSFIFIFSLFNNLSPCITTKFLSSFFHFSITLP